MTNTKTTMTTRILKYNIMELQKVRKVYLRDIRLLSKPNLERLISHLEYKTCSY